MIVEHKKCKCLLSRLLKHLQQCKIFSFQLQNIYLFTAFWDVLSQIPNVRRVQPCQFDHI